MTVNSLSIDLRPQSFAEVIGSADIVAAIQKKIADDQIPIAFLFDGPFGYGKTTLAYLVARAIQGGGEGPFDIDDTNAADFNGVDDVRELVRNSKTYPFNGRYRVHILDEVQKLTEPAQNCLLKALETKDSPTRWILCTTEPGKLLKGLRDRCLAFHLRPLGDQGIAQLVTRAAKALQVSAQDNKRVLSAFVEACVYSDIRSPRAILMAFEKFAAGIELKEALFSPEHEPLYADVAKAVINGNWQRTAELLKQIKTADVRALRAVLAAFLKNRLLESTGFQAEALSAAIRGMLLYNTFEDGIAFAGTCAVMHEACKKLSAAHDPDFDK